MEKYTVLLVDDEEDVIQVIMRKIDWEGLGFSVIGYATNGVKALEMLEEFQPDVVMTDIRMPYMDGMELSKRIRAEYPGTKILLFTGFDEFEYAKEAVHLEVEEYILKPLNSQELTKVFTHLKVKLDQEIDEKRNVEILEKLLYGFPSSLTNKLLLDADRGKNTPKRSGKILKGLSDISAWSLLLLSCDPHVSHAGSGRYESSFAGDCRSEAGDGAFGRKVGGEMFFLSGKDDFAGAVGR